MLIATFTALTITSDGDVSIPNRDLCSLQPDLQLSCIPPIEVSIPNRDLCSLQPDLADALAYAVGCSFNP